LKKIWWSLGGVVAVVVTSVALLPGLLHWAGLHPAYEGPVYQLPGKRALVITTSHGILSSPGRQDGPPTGVFASELTHPYYTFLDGGMAVDIASIAGGEIPVDPLSVNFFVRSPEDERFLTDPAAQEKARHSIPVAEVDIEHYDIIFISGGWGAAYDLAQSDALADSISQAYYGPRSAVIGGVCHGVLGLVRARDASGQLLVAGRRMTGVTDKQLAELAIGMTPLHPETELRKAGASFESSTAFRDFLATHVVVDGERRFVTGQNQNSGLETAHRMMEIIAGRPPTTQ